MNDITVLSHYFAPIARDLESPGVTEVVVNRPGEIGVERAGRWAFREEPALTETWLATLATAAAAFTQQDISPTHPICSTRLPGGARCQIVIPPAAEAISLTLRKPSDLNFSLEDLEENGFFHDASGSDAARCAEAEALCALHRDGDWRGFFELAVAQRRNILISGATGSGKTTFAKTLIACAPSDERLITIEDVRELVVPHRNRVHLLYAKDGQGLARLSAKALLESALRMRPDRILLQELRDEAAFLFLRAAASGHPGAITTLHADSPELALEQLTLLVRESEAGRDLPREDIRAFLRLTVDIIAQVRRMDGRHQLVEVRFEPASKA